MPGYQPSNAAGEDLSDLYSYSYIEFGESRADAYYVSADAVLDAARQHTMFNVVHFDSVVKVDFIVRKATEYRRLEFERRQRIRVGELELWIVSKEDLILSKLFWARDSRSEMQLGDARNLLSTQPDLDYLRRWSSALGVDHLLQECIDE